MTDVEKKGIGKKKIGLAVAVIVVICAVLVISFMFWIKASPKLFVGAYVEYEVEGIALIIPIEGTIRIEVTDVTEDHYTISITPTGIPLMKPETKIYSFDEPIGPAIEEDMEYIGEETISTAIGTRKVVHYYFKNVTAETETDLYIDKTTNVALLVVGEGKGFSAEIRISDTNIKWLGD